MKKLFGEANINVENFNEAERKQKIKVKYYKQNLIIKIRMIL